MKKLQKFIAVLATTLAATLLFVACDNKPDNPDGPDEPVKYTVTYDIDGATGDAPAGGSYAAGETVTLAAATGFEKNGFTFDKWSDGTATYAAGATYTMPAKAVTFTATYTEIQPTAIESIADVAGSWTVGKHTLEIAANADALDGNAQGYAVLDGKYALVVYCDADTQAVASLDGDLSYNMHFLGDTLVLTGSDTITFTEKSALVNAELSEFEGKWAKVLSNSTQPWYITADGTYYGLNLSQASVAAVGQNLIMHFDAAGFTYAYVLTKDGDGLKGYYDANETDPVDTTFVAGTYYILTVEGELNQIVTAGSPNADKVTTPAAPDGQQFAGWVLAGTETPFDLTAAMTADASISATFEDIPAGAELTFTGSCAITTGMFGKTCTKIIINTNTLEYTVTVNNSDSTATATAVSGTDNAWKIDIGGENFWIKISDDGQTLNIYDYQTMDEEDYKGSLTLAA